MRKLDTSTWLLGAVLVASVCVVVYLTVFYQDGRTAVQQSSRLRLQDIPFDGRQAMRFLEEICAIGPRVSGTEGMRRQQSMLVKHFHALGAQVELQRFVVVHPLTGRNVTLANLIVRWHPRSTERILFCAHYDTRPYPDRDRRNPRGRFIGANDGASGVAVLAELGKHMSKLRIPYGVDFVLFDGEELVYNDRRDKYFLGSTHFALDYRNNPPAHRYKWGILLDMVGDKELHLFQEKHSITWPDTRPLTRSIWQTARRLGVREFYHRRGHEIRDDHLPLHNEAGIPTCDIIDFDYPRPGRHVYWHTEQDTPDKCSALSLAKVGWVILEWLKSQR